MLTLLPSPEHLKSHPHQLPDAVDSSLTLARKREALRAFVTLFDDRARADAQRVSAAIKRGESLPLGGWILAVKHNIAVKDQPLTCASKILDGFRSPFTATAVERLERAGAVIIGKTNLDEFAMGSSSENTIFGAVRNPCDPERVPGGSSGGSYGFGSALVGGSSGAIIFTVENLGTSNLNLTGTPRVVVSGRRPVAMCRRPSNESIFVGPYTRNKPMLPILFK
jgi:Asp-tRNA(Asn)/Glu-tRNA(Gln) amidotransferase A subunit family amidase